jgi:hypothetical protein
MMFAAGTGITDVTLHTLRNHVGIILAALAALQVEASRDRNPRSHHLEQRSQQIAANGLAAIEIAPAFSVMRTSTFTGSDQG